MIVWFSGIEVKATHDVGGIAKNRATEAESNVDNVRGLVKLNASGSDTAYGYRFVPGLNQL